MTRRDAVEYIQQHYGLIFSIRFIKRTTGELREMVCRQGVKKGLVEIPSRDGVDWKQHGLIPVWDMGLKAYRSIPIEGIREIKVEGEWVAVTD